MNILFAIIFLISLYAIYNLINFLRYPIIEKYLLYTYSSDSSQRMKSMTHKNQIINYMKNAGVKDKSIPIVQALGYGQLASASVSIFDNILNQRQDVAQIAFECLLEAKGNYWSRFINSFNPFYWLRIVIFIPKNIFMYFGIKESSIFIKIFQLIYWLIAVICTFLIAVFPEEIKTFIFSLFNIS